MERKIVCYERKNRFLPLEDGSLYSEKNPIFSDSFYGKLVLQNSLILLLKDIVISNFKNSKLNVEHTINGGLYCEVFSDVLLCENDIAKINEIIEKRIDGGENFSSKYKTKEELLEIFKYEKDKFELLSNSEINGAFLCEYNNVKEFFFTPVVNSTSVLKGSFIKYYPPGFIVYISKDNVKSEQKKLFSIFNESEKWAKILGWRSVKNVKESIENDEIFELIHVCEALHEKKIVEIANFVDSQRGKLKMILISGPSSSGKTTFLKRLLIQLKVLGLSVVGISLDDYFLDNDKVKVGDDGKKDFESIDALDVELFNKNLNSLIKGEEILNPKFDFPTGKRSSDWTKLKMGENSVLIVEGIHGLNERLTETIPKEIKLKIYVSALTQINIDNTHRISTTDNRLIRRIVRDYLFRNHSAETTLKMWKHVRDGEEKNIFPYQESADFFFNSSLLYELSVLKNFAKPLLQEIDEKSDFYLDSRRLLFILSFFKEISIEKIPHTSVLREFVGGSAFKY
ncbi:MAG: nucleoside kinase [bacterium]|nr:nucleoside kinase [bacterium]